MSLLQSAQKPLDFACGSGSGQGIVRVRMYRSFRAMWLGWKKNLYPLIGGTPGAVFGELEVHHSVDAAALILVGIKIPSF